MNVCPGELNAIEPVVAVKVKSSAHRIVKALSVALTVPEIIMSDVVIKLDARVKVPLGLTPLPVKLTVAPELMVNVLLDILPLFNVKLAAFEVFVILAATVIPELAFRVSERSVVQITSAFTEIVPACVPAADVKMIMSHVEPRLVTRDEFWIFAVLAVTA